MDIIDPQGAMAQLVQPTVAPLERPPAWRHVVEPVPRATAFYTRSWRRWLAGRSSDVPVVRPTVLLGGHALFDEVVMAGFRLTRSGAGPEDIARIEQEALDALAQYGAAGWMDAPAAFLPEPPDLGAIVTRADRTRRVAYERWSFESGYEPHAGEPGRKRWLAYSANRQASAWVLRHEEPRPWLVCIHGAVMGRPVLDLAMFRARWLHQDLGLNVALPVLPLHGLRREGTTAAFPGEDVLDNIHGFAQAVWDIRRLIGRLRQDGQPVGVSGISLGGYVAGVLAGVEDGLACAILGVPLVDLAELADRSWPMDHDPAWRRVMALARQLNEVVSPLALPPMLPLDRRFIYAGVADRLVHPRHQVLRLWEHWDRPTMQWYEGGHVGFFRSPPVGRYVAEALEASGLVSDARH